MNYTSDLMIVDKSETKYLSTEQISKLKNAKYGIAGAHSGVQICSWNKKALRQEGVCYKQKFYGVECEKCAQMSPSVLWCNENCIFCWRPMEWMRDSDMSKIEIDEPKKIIDETVKERTKLLMGYGGLDSLSKERFEAALIPSHWAISLSGEPTLYPKICELIVELKAMPETKSVFLVTNAQKKEVFEKMDANKDFCPDQLYVSLDAPNEELFNKVNRPYAKDGWSKLLASLKVISKLKTRKLIRITLIKDLNDSQELLKQWSEIVKIMSPEFVEVKSYMHLGLSRDRLTHENMPLFEDIENWANAFAKESGYVVKDSSPPSRIVLLVREDLKDKSTKFKFAREEMGIETEGIDF